MKEKGRKAQKPAKDSWERGWAAQRSNNEGYKWELCEDCTSQVTWRRSLFSCHGARHKEVRTDSGQNGPTGRVCERKEKGGAQWACGAESAQGETTDWTHSTDEAKMTTTSNVALTVQIMRLEGHWEWEGKDHEVQKQAQHTDRDPQQAGGWGGGMHSVTRRVRDPGGGVTVLLCGCDKPWRTRKFYTEREK